MKYTLAYVGLCSWLAGCSFPTPPDADTVAAVAEVCKTRGMEVQVMVTTSESLVSCVKAQ